MEKRWDGIRSQLGCLDRWSGFFAFCFFLLAVFNVRVSLSLSAFVLAQLTVSAFKPPNCLNAHTTSISGLGRRQHFPFGIGSRSLRCRNSKQQQKKKKRFSFVLNFYVSHLEIEIRKGGKQRKKARIVHLDRNIHHLFVLTFEYSNTGAMGSWEKRLIGD